MSKLILIQLWANVKFNRALKLLIVIMMNFQSSVSKIPEKILSLVRVNWVFPIIFAFLTIMFSSVGLLAVGSSQAETTARVAYFALGAGTMLQLVFFSRNKLKNGDTSDASS